MIADNEVPGGETEGGGGNNDGDGTSGDDGGDDGGGSEGEGKGEETGGNGKGGGGNPDYSEVCKSPAWRGDGYCDDENNNYGCGYDGGDCCENFLDHWNKYCEVGGLKSSTLTDSTLLPSNDKCYLVLYVSFPGLPLPRAPLLLPMPGAQLGRRRLLRR